MTTLSLEPLLSALRVSPSAKEPEAPEVEDGGGGGGDPGPASLAYRLQRLWQERGDFKKLTAEALQCEEDEEDEDDGAAGTESGKVQADTREAREGQEAGNEHEDDEEDEATEDGASAISQHLSPEELWELKSTILQGLG